VAVSPDPPDRVGAIITKVTSETRKDFAITLLSDYEHTVTDRYGLRNPQALARGFYVPHPTTYVIDAKGVVRWKFTEPNYQVRPTNQQILAELQKLPAR
jgi:peroxiredoxin